MPFVTLWLTTSDSINMEINILYTFFTCSFALWLLMNSVFFYTIDSSFLNTFFGSMTGPQFTCRRFRDTLGDDHGRFVAVFGTRLSYTKSIHGEVKTWVEENVDIWTQGNVKWFQADKVPDEFLPPRVVVAEGGASRRRRSSVSFKELVGGGESK